MASSRGEPLFFNYVRDMLGCLGQRWLKILWKMWQTHRPFDAELHQRNQVKHGSWVIALTTPTPEQRTTAEMG